MSVEILLVLTSLAIVIILLVGIVAAVRQERRIRRDAIRWAMSSQQKLRARQEAAARQSKVAGLSLRRRDEGEEACRRG